MKPTKWQKAGVIGVDAGICWIGDPCYILHQDNPETNVGVLGRDWPEFCAKIRDNLVTQFNYSLGHPGLGVVVSTGYGDGTYPVFVKYNKEGRVVEVKVVFDYDDEVDDGD